MLRRLALFAVIAALLAVPSAASAAPTHQLPPGVLAAVAQVPPTVTTAQPATVASLALHPSVRTHRAVSGDTLWALAGRYCGNPLLFGHLAAANRVHPDRIYAGVVYRMDCAGVQGTPPARAPARPAATTTSSGWVHPLRSGVLARTGGCWHDPRPRHLHQGVDLTVRSGTPIRAARSGTVIRAGWNGGYGYAVDIRHSSSTATRYAHMSRIAVRGGQRVSTGQVIGYVGSTGASSGPHLHFEVARAATVSGNQVNPSPFMRARGVKVGC